MRTMNDLNLQKEQDELTHYLCSRTLQGKLPEWVEETYGKAGIHSRVICLRISDMEDLNENHTEEARLFVHHTIVNVTEQALKSLGEVLINSVDEEYKAVILFTEQEILEEELTGKIKEIFSVVRDLVHIGMDAGISNGREGFGELASMYQMARAATAYRFVYGIDSIITEEQMAKKLWVVKIILILKSASSSEGRRQRKICGGILRDCGGTERLFYSECPGCASGHGGGDGEIL